MNQFTFFLCVCIFVSGCSSTPATNQKVPIAEATIVDSTELYVASQCIPVRKDLVLVDLSSSVTSHIPVPDSAAFWSYYNAYRKLPGIKMLAITIVTDREVNSIRYYDTVVRLAKKVVNLDEALDYLQNDYPGINNKAIINLQDDIERRSATRFSEFLADVGKMLHTKTISSNVQQNLDHIVMLMREPMPGGSKSCAIHSLLMTDLIDSKCALGQYDLSDCNEILVLGAARDRAASVIKGNVQIIENFSAGINYSLSKN